jgi:hypothetical protein
MRYSDSRALILSFIILFIILLGYSTTRRGEVIIAAGKIIIHRETPVFRDIITGELATSNVVWNTSLTFSTAPFPHTDELRLAIIATDIKSRFTELKVLP